MNERLKYYRTQSHLSQAYVASILKISRRTMILVEQGKSKLSAEQLSVLSELYGVTVDTLINGESNTASLEDLNKVFNNLSEEDKREVIQFIQFKSQNSRK